MSRMVTTTVRHFGSVYWYETHEGLRGKQPYREYAVICFIPGNRPDPLEESAASQTWREMTEHMREQHGT